MYYVVIYNTFDQLSPKAVFHLIAGLEYADRAEAERYKQELVQQAQNYGASIITYRGAGNDGYTTIKGPIIFGVHGMMPRKSGSNKYKIGIEDDASLGALVPEEEKSSIAGKTFIDGFSFEERAKRFKQQKDTEAQAKQDIINKHFNNFKSEIATIDDVRSVLEILLKYSAKKIPQDLLIDLVVKKIQGEPDTAKEETDWYSELSNIN
jgi:hypothetical protein